MNPQVNHQVGQFEITHTHSKKVSCGGADQSSGHPFIYLNIGKNDSITCPYCSKTFVLEKKSKRKINRK
jgi:uncharacterized Zn-finger protein